MKCHGFSLKTKTINEVELKKWNGLLGHLGMDFAQFALTGIRNEEKRRDLFSTAQKRKVMPEMVCAKRVGLSVRCAENTSSNQPFGHRNKSDQF